jgi:hypothetical protein
MRLILPSLFLILLTVACTATKERNAVSENKPPKEKLLSYRDTIVETDSTFEIGKACAVFFSPSDAELERLKKEIGEEDYFITMDDYMWYFSESSTFLEEKGLKTITTSEKSVHVHLLNGSIKTFYPGDTTIGWSPLLFDGKNTIKKTDLVNIQPDYDALFK